MMMRRVLDGLYADDSEYGSPEEMDAFIAAHPALESELREVALRLGRLTDACLQLKYFPPGCEGEYDPGAFEVVVDMPIAEGKEDLRDTDFDSYLSLVGDLYLDFECELVSTRLKALGLPVEACCYVYY